LSKKNVVKLIILILAALLNAVQTVNEIGERTVPDHTNE